MIRPFHTTCYLNFLAGIVPVIVYTLSPETRALTCNWTPYALQKSIAFFIKTLSTNLKEGKMIRPTHTTCYLNFLAGIVPVFVYTLQLETHGPNCNWTPYALQKSNAFLINDIIYKSKKNGKMILPFHTTCYLNFLAGIVLVIVYIFCNTICNSIHKSTNFLINTIPG
jgi:hypothetical protein